MKPFWQKVYMLTNGLRDHVHKGINLKIVMMSLAKDQVTLVKGITSQRL